MLRVVTAMTLLALAAPAKADEWTTTDTAFQAAVAGLQLVDWGQTRYGLDKGWHEGNPLLGPHPNPLRLGLSASGAMIGHALVAYILPQPYRRIWQVLGLGIEIDMVHSNYARVGLAVRWP